MSDNKKYYYLKLKDNFFDSEEILVLEAMENGYKYSNILLKMYLRSLKRDGLLMFKDKIPYDPKMIATVTGHNINDVKQALQLFNEMDLIEILPNGAIYMMDIQNYIGTSSSEADRIRAYRNEIEDKKQQMLEGETVDLNVDVTNVQQMNDISTPEIELEKEKELERDINNKDGCGLTNPDKLKKEGNQYIYPQDFEEIWGTYPRKDGKKAAYKEYYKLINDGEEHQLILDTVKKLAEAKQDDDPQYIMHLRKFIGPNEYWRDWINKEVEEQSDDEVYREMMGV